MKIEKEIVIIVVLFSFAISLWSSTEIFAKIKAYKRANYLKEEYTIRKVQILEVDQEERPYSYKVLLPLLEKESLATYLVGGPYYELTKESHIYVIYDPKNPKEVYWNDVDTSINWFGMLMHLVVILFFGGVIIYAYRGYQKGNII